MKIDVKKSTLVKPTEATPHMTLWMSSLDQLRHSNFYTPSIYLFRFNGAENFFDPGILQAALGRTLVHFYPVAGRLQIDGQGRMEIDCNGKGALFVEAEADCDLEDLGYLDNPISRDLCPSVDRSQGTAMCPIFLVQMTRFKCGGICLGFAFEHNVVDGIAALYFKNTWANIARGLDIAIHPVLDRRSFLSARDPPQAKFAHVEYQPPPVMMVEPNDTTQGPLVSKMLKLTESQMNALKEKCKEEDGNVRYSSFTVLAGHIWRCASLALQVPEDQEMKLRMSVNGRGRLQPPLPEGYFGNVVFNACPIALAGELCSNPVKFAVRKVHQALIRLDNEYLRSAIDYMELQPDFRNVSTNLYGYKLSKLGINSWNRLPFYDADFGWGKPTFTGRAGVPPLGDTFILPANDGSVAYAITLPKEDMDRFENLFYDI